MDEPNRLTRDVKIHLTFAAYVAISVLIFSRDLIALSKYCFENDSSSHIILVPFLAGFLIYFGRQRIFSIIRQSWVVGSSFILLGIILILLSNRNLLPREGNWPLCISTLGVVLAWTGGFVFLYGCAAFKAAAIPMLLLLLMVPLPNVILDCAIRALQEGSADIAYLIFKLVGTPVWRNGLLLSVPGVTIEVAKECSSIRSSIALVITCLLAAQLYLRTAWKVLLLVVVSLLLSVVKNGIRIATLTLLSIYVDPGFLFGRLHREGGFAFFALALLLIWPVFTLLERSDRLQRISNSTS